MVDVNLMFIFIVEVGFGVMIMVFFVGLVIRLCFLFLLFLKEVEEVLIVNV